MNKYTEKKFILGIDIGGTKIDAQLFEVKNGGINNRDSWNAKHDTVLGLEPHIKQVTEVISEAAEQAKTLGGSISAIGIGSPGRFNSEGEIKPNTNPSLGKDTGEFDNINLKEAYQKSIAAAHPELSKASLHVHNDGDAMLAGILEGVAKGSVHGLQNQANAPVNKHSFIRKHVALFGIGPGVGHAIASVQDNGSVDFVTDGHASKLRVKVDDADMPILRAAKERMEQSGDKAEILIFDDNTVRAEDLFRGPVISALAGANSGRFIDTSEPEHEAALEFAGKYMARTIAVIKSGESVDVEPANGWTDEDKLNAGKTSLYIIGGGMGSSPLGKEIIKFAANELATLDIKDIQLVQAGPENSAARAAATLVPESVYLGSPSVAR